MPDVASMPGAPAEESARRYMKLGLALAVLAIVLDQLSKWIIVVVLFFWLRKAHRRLPAIGLGLVIGGALGNVIDRIRLGAVADFLLFHWNELYWPAFNIADCAIFIGVAALLVDALFGSRESHK